MNSFSIEIKQLPIHFHETFLFDLNLISSLLRFIADGKIETKEEISKLTGIPTGKSTGKVEPMIKYAYAMGLIDATLTKQKWNLKLTTLGRVIYGEDSSFIEPVTFWILHLMLCRRINLSDPIRGVINPWHSLFALSDIWLGKQFSKADLLTFLSETHGKSPSLDKLASIIIRTYTLQAVCLGNAKILVEEDNVILRKSAPRYSEFFPAYTAALFISLDELIPNVKQFNLDEFIDNIGLLNILNWPNTQATSWIDWMIDNQFIQLDRQTGQPIALKLKHTEQVLNELYSETA